MVSPRIDPDPASQLFDPFGDGVAVNNGYPMIPAVAEKRLADPAQIDRGLPVERDARPDSGMNEKVVAEAEAVAKLVEKALVGRRDPLPHFRERALGRQGEKVHCIDAIACQAFFAAEAKPLGKQLFFPVQQPKQHLFMVPRKNDRLETGERPGADPLDHFARLRPAVDQVAKKDKNGPDVPTPPPVIRLDLPKQAVQQVMAAVDVPDRIGPPAVRAAPDRELPRAPATKHQVQAPPLRERSAPPRACR